MNRMAEMIGEARLAKGLYWTKSWNLVGGCTKVSPGCEHCWCEAEARRFSSSRNPKLRESYGGLVNLAGRWSGVVRFRGELLGLPARTRGPSVWAIWTDLFHPDILNLQIGEAWMAMRAAPRHLFLVLTKRPDRLDFWTRHCMQGRPWPDNIAVGVTACNQEEADRNIPILLSVPAALHFLSIEPMLGALDLMNVTRRIGDVSYVRGPVLNPDPRLFNPCNPNRGVDWVICGGESGPGARPTHPDWVRSLRDQCQGTGVPFFFKQWGEWLPDEAADPTSYGDKEMPLLADGTDCRGYDALIEKDLGAVLMRRVGKRAAGRTLDGREWLELPDWKTDRP